MSGINSTINILLADDDMFYEEEKAGHLYNSGASYYICKPSDFEELKNVVHKIITLLSQNILQPSKENFYVNKLKTAL